MEDASRLISRGTAVLLLVGSMLGCRIGGGSGALEVDDGAQVDAAADSGEGGRGGMQATPTPPTTSNDAAATDADTDAAGTEARGGRGGMQSVMAGASVEARGGAGAGDGDDSGMPNQPDADGCRAETMIEGCNPITNSGCAAELGMQCDVDLFAPTLGGVCVFSAPAPTPDACLAIPPTQTCPAKQTCVEGACRTVCLCDADCGAGSCCTDLLGEQGFKTCSKC